MLGRFIGLTAGCLDDWFKLLGYRCFDGWLTGCLKDWLVKQQDDRLIAWLIDS